MVITAFDADGEVLYEKLLSQPIFYEGLQDKVLKKSQSGNYLWYAQSSTLAAQSVQEVFRIASYETASPVITKFYYNVPEK